MKFNLSETTELIRNRRSIMPEQYLERKVHREQIEVILTNGTWAPSHGMTQPWRFKVFMGSGLKKLADFLPELYKMKTPPDQFKESKYMRFQERPLKTSVIIMVCMERDPSGKISEMEEIEAQGGEIKKDFELLKNTAIKTSNVFIPRRKQIG